MRKAIFLAVVVFVLLLPFVFSFPCDVTSDPAYCKEIENSNIPEKEEIFSSLLYQDSISPNHNFVEQYNKGIKVISPPKGTPIYNSRFIKNAWLSFLVVFPSVYENDLLYVPSQTKALSEYGYNIQIPNNYYPNYPQTSQGDCKRKHYLTKDQAILQYQFKNNGYQAGKLATININSDGAIISKLKLLVQVKIKHYKWKKIWSWWGQKYVYKCKYSYTNYESDSFIIKEDKDVKLYTKQPSADVTITNDYLNTTKGEFIADNYSFFKLSFVDSYLTKQKYYYDLVFDKKPYYIAYLRANTFTRETQKNLYVSKNTFFVKDAVNCNIFAYNHFFTLDEACDLTLQQETVEPLTMEEKELDFSLLLYTLIFLLVLYVIYKLVKSQFKRIIIPVLLLLLFIPTVAAASDSECGITNLASCIPQKIYDFILVLINAPLLPMLAIIQKLLLADINIELFHHLWSIIRYILGFFYLFFFLYAGYIFLVANADPIKRAHAKDLLKNTVIMIVLIQGSYYIYDLLLSLSNNLSSSLLPMIDPYFFLLTADNIVNIGLEFLFSGFYGITLFFTMLLLVVRYIIICFGVVLFPIGLFCYFIPPLKGYGKFILNTLGIFIFIAFFDLLIILASSMLITAPVFANIKILVMITCFLIINYTLWLAIKFALKRSTNVSLKDDLNQAVKYIALL